MNRFDFLAEVYDEQCRFTQSDLDSLRRVCKEMYGVLRPLFDSRKLEPVKSDFAVKRFFHRDKFVEPDRYFRFVHGTLVIEISRRANRNYSVRTHDFDAFPDKFDINLRGDVRSIAPIFLRGWRYFGLFKASEFVKVVSLYRFLVRVAVDRLFNDFDDTSFEYVYNKDS